MAESFGLLRIESASQIAERERLEAEQRQAVQQPIISSLAGHLQKSWQAAKQAKTPIEQRMIRALRQRAGIYEPDKLAAIQQMGGSEVYVLLTLTKCRAAEAWIKDVLSPVNDKPWNIEPTPISEIPPEIDQQISLEVSTKLQQVISQYQQMQPFLPDIEAFREPLREYISSMRDEAKERLQEEAERRTNRMSLKIEDQLDEGGWYDSFQDFIADVVTFPVAVLKGPVVRKRKVQKWVQGQAGWEMSVEEELVPEFERISPFDIYPAPDSRSVDDGYIIERHKLTRTDLVSLIGVPGYSDGDIRIVLAEHLGVKSEMLAVDSERAMLELGQTDGLLKTEKIEALEFWGSVQGSMLLDWGMGGDLDPDLEYEVNAWLIGNHVIRAIINPDKLGRKPYSFTSYEKVPGSIWGRGVPELMADIQDVCNAACRAIVNNAGMASGPQVEVDVERVIGDTEDIWPWKIWQSTNQQMREGNAVKFNQPIVITEPLLAVYQFFSAMADEQTGVPKWTHGDTNIGGAGETSSGLSMLMTYSARGIKQVISHIDAAVASAISRLYDYNMLYDPDESIKGDAKIVARGSSSLVAKEQRITRTNEFLMATNNPVDMQIIGLKGRAKLLREAAKALELDTDEIIPGDEQELEAMLQQVQQQMIMQASAPSGPGGSVPGSQQKPGAKPEKLDAAGNPQGGEESNYFPNKPGDNPSGNLPRREYGGWVDPTQKYQVGEAGPEVFMPKPTAGPLVGSKPPAVSEMFGYIDDGSDLVRAFGKDEKNMWMGRDAAYGQIPIGGKVVGQNGPETFRPEVAGYIYPNPKTVAADTPALGQPKVNSDQILSQVLSEYPGLGKVFNANNVKVMFANPDRVALSKKYGGGQLEYWPQTEPGINNYLHPNGGKTNVLEIFSDELKNNPARLKQAIYGDLMHGMTADPIWSKYRNDFSVNFTPEERQRIESKQSWWEDANGAGFGKLPTIDAYIRGYLNERDIAMQGHKKTQGTMYSPRQLQILDLMDRYLKKGR